MATSPKYFVTQDYEKYNLDEFLSQCKDLGFVNNTSRDKLRFDWMEENNGAYWAFVKDNKIISMSGCHPFPDIDNAYRIGYRSATLPGEDPFKGFSRYGHNGIPNRVLFQYQIRWCQSFGIMKFILTTNCDSDVGHMHMSHLMQVRINQCTNLSTYLGDRIVNGVNQSLWKYNIEEYVKSIKSLKQEEYYIIDQLKW